MTRRANGGVDHRSGGCPVAVSCGPGGQHDGQLTARTLGSATGRVVTGDSFTGAGQRLSEVGAAVGATTPATVRDDTYLFDSVGNPLSIRDLVAGQSQCYGYDTRDRLTSEQAPKDGLRASPRRS